MHIRFTTRPLILSATIAAVLLSGCAGMSETQKGTAIGAAGGAGLGALIGKATGNTGKGAAIGGIVGAVAGNIWSKKMEDKKAAMEAATKGTGVDIARTADNQLKVNVPGDFSFDVGQAKVKPVMQPVLNKLASGLDATHLVSIVGYTDSTGSATANTQLSINRAEAVRDYMVGQGIAASRIDVSGKGAADPVADNGTTEGRAKNRRVEIFLREAGAQ
ncbi:MAG: OmpA family protein [Leptothrix ochracea]|uniref:OmpA family protein n=1 Tax=Leptothrix ochracea TaxID=735331 RepID=UPI0034E24991